MIIRIFMICLFSVSPALGDPFHVSLHEKASIDTEFTFYPITYHASKYIEITDSVDTISQERFIKYINTVTEECSAVQSQEAVSSISHHTTFGTVGTLVVYYVRDEHNVFLPPIIDWIALDLDGSAQFSFDIESILQIVRSAVE